MRGAGVNVSPFIAMRYVLLQVFFFGDQVFWRELLLEVEKRLEIGFLVGILGDSLPNGVRVRVPGVWLGEFELLENAGDMT